MSNGAISLALVAQHSTRAGAISTYIVCWVWKPGTLGEVLRNVGDSLVHDDRIVQKRQVGA